MILNRGDASKHPLAICVENDAPAAGLGRDFVANLAGVAFDIQPSVDRRCAGRYLNVTLLVDDVDLVLESLASCLQREFNVFTASNGMEAWETSLMSTPSQVPCRVGG